ncbi:MAG: hypothetical protein ACOZNI_27820 [Myxococcota bacterium]
MNYWWINHSADAIVDERGCSLLFAPLKDAGGRDPAHWRRIESVAAGDVLFSVRAKGLAAILTATACGRRMPYPECYTKPARLGGRPDGRGITVKWQELPEPRPIFSLLSTEEAAQLLGTGLPLDRNRNQKQGYVFTVPQAIGRRLQEAVGRRS